MSRDIFNDLHTLRALALDVKATADKMHLLTIATLCASMAETATQAIEKFPQLHYTHESPQILN